MAAKNYFSQCKNEVLFDLLDVASKQKAQFMGLFHRLKVEVVNFCCQNVNQSIFSNAD